MHNTQDHVTRIINRIELENDCWVYVCKYYNKWGYARMITGSRTDGSRKNEYVHRVSYKAFIGNIPDKMPLDHLCQNTKCVNPDHLEIVTTTENNRRKTKPNCGVCGDKKDYRYGKPLCITCKRRHARAYMKKKRSFTTCKKVACY